MAGVFLILGRAGVSHIEFACELPSSDAFRDRETVENVNPTNHMRPTGVGAFILPSVVEAPAADVVQCRTCDMPFRRAMQCEAHHREPV
jgi:hypothetical protein